MNLKAKCDLQNEMIYEHLLSFSTFVFAFVTCSFVLVRSKNLFIVVFFVYERVLVEYYCVLVLSSKLLWVFCDSHKI